VVLKELRQLERHEEDDMPDANNWNEKTIAEFRANEGRVGGPFEGAPVVLEGYSAHSVEV
jgi:hypothetical protein